MEIRFTIQAKKDLDYWRKTGSKAIQNKITRMLSEILENPNSLKGIGKPELLSTIYRDAIAEELIKSTAWCTKWKTRSSK